MTLRKRKATGGANGEAPAKRASKARGAKKQDDPVWATENANSRLVSRDLHAEYCDPATYEGWTKEDWEEIHDCLPDNAPFNEDGYSVPMTFFKYDTDWRRIVREFQEDLGAGFYESQWQKEATQAMEERAAGHFDKYKEDQFEAFWGQKQKLSHEDRAGDSAKIKLSELVEAGRIKLGDDLSFRRNFDKKRESGGGKWMIEKEMKIISIDGSSLTVAIPPGQNKYSKIAHQAQPPKEKRLTDDEGDQDTKSVGPETPATKEKEGACQNTTNGITSPNQESKHAEQPRTDSASDTIYFSERRSTRANGTLLLNSDETHTYALKGVQQLVACGTDGTKVNDSREVLSNAESAPADSPDSLYGQADTSDTLPQGNVRNNATVQQCQTVPSNGDINTIDRETGCFIHEIKTVKNLVEKIIEIDGRLSPKDAPIVSNWRFIRLQRKNQDLGSLFDVREEYYVWSSPTIVKTPKQNNGKRDPRVNNHGSGDAQKKTPRKAKAVKSKDLPDNGHRSSQESTQSPTPTEDSDDDAGERQSDGNFEATESRSRKTASRPSQKRKGASSKRNGIGEEKSKSNSEKTAHQEPSRKALRCSKCGNSYASPYTLNRHMKGYCKGSMEAD